MIDRLEAEIAGRNIWVFGSRKGQYYDDNSKHLFEYVLRAENEIYPVWITKNQVVEKQLRQNGLPVFLAGSAQSDYCMANAKVCFICIIHADLDQTKLTSRTWVVQLWHGTPMKQNNIANYRQRFDLVCLASKLFLKEQALGPHDQFNFQLTGYPRNDFLLSDSVPSFLSADKIEILKTKKVIGFLPTYNEEKDLNKTGDQRGKAYDIWEGLDFERLERLLEKNNAVFVVKLHALQSPADCETQQKMNRSRNIIVVDSDDPMTDVYAYLKYTDMLITDYSSVLFDYLLLDRPVVFSCFDLDLYSQRRNLRFDYNEITPGPKTGNWSMALNELERLLAGEDSYSGQRKRVKDMFNYYQGGGSCQRIVKLAKELYGG